MKYSMRFFAAGILAAGLLFPAGGNLSAQGGKPTTISLATGGVAGVYFPLGGAIAQSWTEEVPELTVTAESTGASVVNVRLIERGEAELALVQNDIASYAYHAQEMFKDGKPLQKVLGMAMFYPEVIQIVTLQRTGVATVDQLKGKRVAVGAPGSGTEANARQILEAHGITYRDISEQFLPFGEAVDALRDGRIDAAFLTAGIPTAAVIDLDATEKVSIVSINPDVAEKIVSRWPFYSAFTVPAGTYKSIEKDIPTVTVQAMLVVNADVSARAVEQMLKVLFSEGTLKRLCDTHVRGCDVTRKGALTGLPIPLHPGAANFYGGQL